VIRDVLAERSTLSRTRARFRAYFLTSIAVVILSAVPTETVLATAPATNTAPATTTTLASTAASVASTTNLGQGTGTDAGTTPPSAVAPTAPAAPAKLDTIVASSVIVALARTHLGASYRLSATGPWSFDCSGLVWRVFEQAHLGRKVTSHSARAIYLAYRNRGLASRRNPQVGDIVVWGYGSHVGIYVGNGLAISALVEGVRVHRVNALTTPFTAYLHTDLAGVRVPVRYLPRTLHASTKPTKPTTKPSLSPIAHATVAVKLRTGHSTSNTPIATLAAGTRFHVLARAHDRLHRLWLRVRLLGGRTGWLVASYAHA
jgi:cell wall-associated NlpC family hydrolase